MTNEEFPHHTQYCLSGLYTAQSNNHLHLTELQQRMISTIIRTNPITIPTDKTLIYFRLSYLLHIIRLPIPQPTLQYPRYRYHIQRIIEKL
jgi:hypothetical protein